MTDDQEMDLSAESENPEENVEASESVDPVADEGTPDVDAEAESAEPADAGEVAVAEDESSDAEVNESKVVNEDDASEDDAEAAMLEMLEGLPDEDDKASADDINFGGATASRAEFQHLQEPVTAPESHNIELLMDVDLPISIELGRTKLPISDILALGPGSVVELNKLAGEPVDLLVNNKVVAKGEVVVVDENFGLRITQLMTPEERLKALAQE